MLQSSLPCLIVFLIFFAFNSNAQPSGKANKKKLSPEKYDHAYNYYSEKQYLFLNDTIYNQPLSSLDPRKLETFQRLMQSARAAFEQKRFEHAFLILKSAEETRIINKEFYLMLGIATYYFDDKQIGERYLLRGYDKLGCFECKEAVMYLY